MTFEYSIKLAVNKFLGWKLPQDFFPDCGISFDGRKDDEWNKGKTWPTGTNLLSADQAMEMFEYCLGADKEARKLDLAIEALKACKVCLDISDRKTDAWDAARSSMAKVTALQDKFGETK